MKQSWLIYFGVLRMFNKLSTVTLFRWKDKTRAPNLLWWCGDWSCLGLRDQLPAAHIVEENSSKSGYIFCFQFTKVHVYDNVYSFCPPNVIGGGHLFRHEFYYSDKCCPIQSLPRFYQHNVYFAVTFPSFLCSCRFAHLNIYLILFLLLNTTYVLVIDT